MRILEEFFNLLMILVIIIVTLIVILLMHFVIIVHLVLSIVDINILVVTFNGLIIKNEFLLYGGL